MTCYDCPDVIHTPSGRAPAGWCVHMKYKWWLNLPRVPEESRNAISPACFSWCTLLKRGVHIAIIRGYSDLPFCSSVCRNLFPPFPFFLTLKTFMTVARQWTCFAHLGRPFWLVVLFHTCFSHQLVTDRTFDLLVALQKWNILHEVSFMMVEFFWGEYTSFTGIFTFYFSWLLVFLSGFFICTGTSACKWN